MLLFDVQMINKKEKSASGCETDNQLDITG